MGKLDQWTQDPHSGNTKQFPVTQPQHHPPLSLPLPTSLMRQHPFRPTEVEERARFVCMWVDGMSVRTIAQQTGASLTTVYRWIRRWQREGCVENRARSGRPRLSLRKGNHHPSRQAVSHPTYSLHDPRPCQSCYTPNPDLHYQDGVNRCLNPYIDPLNNFIINQEFRFPLGHSAACSAFKGFVPVNEHANQDSCSMSMLWLPKEPQYLTY